MIICLVTISQAVKINIITKSVSPLTSLILTPTPLSLVSALGPKVTLILSQWCQAYHQLKAVRKEVSLCQELSFPKCIYTQLTSSLPSGICTNVTILVSSVCCNKLPQTMWLKTTEIHCPIVLEGRSSKQEAKIKVSAEPNP